MNAIAPEKIETTVDDSNLAAVSEVEAGIRDFVRNDVAYLRRSPGLASTEAAPDATAEATVTNVHSLIRRVAAVGIALHHQSRGQHHGQRHGCKDESHEFQSAAVGHRRPLVFTALCRT